jgi:hypothetical protein
MAMSTSVSFGLVMEMENWYAAQFLALPEEKQDMMMKEKDEMMALFNF